MEINPEVCYLLSLFYFITFSAHRLRLLTETSCFLAHFSFQMLNKVGLLSHGPLDAEAHTPSVCSFYSLQRPLL